MKWLSHPLTAALEVDDPETTRLRRRIIQEKAFLRSIYREWYAAIAAALPGNPGPVLELGSGGGFLKEFIPGLITSEVFPFSDVDMVMDGQHLPFVSSGLRGIVMVNVLHHLPQPRLFFGEAARCLRPGGKIIMIEPWVTGWSKIIYGRLHPEPFQPEAGNWEFPTSGPLSGANGALPWMIFERDRAGFQQEYPQLVITKISLGMPFRYLLSGGVSLMSLSPGWTFKIWRRLESLLRPWMKRLAMFAQIEIVNNDLRMLA